MSVFCFKKLKEPDKNFLQLRKAREDKGISLEALELSTHIPQKYIIAIEENRPNDLPKAKGFRTAYIREYTRALNINSSCLFRNFDCLENSPDYSLISTPSTSPRHFFVFRSLGIVIIVLLFSAYLFWQIRGIISSPELAIYAPKEGMVSQESSITIQGEATKESRLTINGQETMIDEQGRFQSTIDLTKGVNTIMVSAAKKHGGSTTIVRHVVVQEKTTQVSIK